MAVPRDRCPWPLDLRVFHFVSKATDCTNVFQFSPLFGSCGACALAAFFRFWPILAFWPWILEDKQAQSPVIIECVLSRPVHNIFKADSYGKICDEISSPQLLSPACVKC